MRNNYLPENILRSMETLAEATLPYQAAVDALKQNTDLFSSFCEPLTSKLGLMDSALRKGFFDDNLSKSVSALLAPYHEIADAQAAIKALGSSFQPMLNPEWYTTINTMASTISKVVQPIDIPRIQSALKPLIQATESVDTTWLKNSSAWLVEKNALSGLAVCNLSGIASGFSRLCKLEYETSLLANMPKKLTSAASQIASITVALEKELPLNWKYDDWLSTSTLINDYCGLATRQHELLQRASNPSEISWRLGIIDVASKFVDRQVGWYLEFSNAVANEEITASKEECHDTDSTVLSLIPTHLGYTRRIDKTPSEGLEGSLIVTITEKGKTIADNVIKINKLRLDNGEDRVFGFSETVVGGLLNLSTSVCGTEDQLGRIVDVLYFVFYENLKHIKILIGQGDENKGDQMVRNEDVYQCIFDVKTIRSDLRHDLDHGRQSEAKKKLKSVGDCYKKYCGARPIKEKDYKKLQEHIYDRIIKLEESLIQIIMQ